MKNVPDFKNDDTLLPAVIQDSFTKDILMHGYMNKESYEKTLETRKVTFYSRSRKTLWTKGETSGNFLILEQILADCDSDAILIKASPRGPTCHTGQSSCFNDSNGVDNLVALEESLISRIKEASTESYTTELYGLGIDRIAQKVGEEAIETVIASKNKWDDEFVGEVSDLVYHLTVLLIKKKMSWSHIFRELDSRQKKKSKQEPASLG